LVIGSDDLGHRQQRSRSSTATISVIDGNDLVIDGKV
jgi:hypothetical protein